MNIKSINEYIKAEGDELYNLFNPLFESRPSVIGDVTYFEYVVPKYQDMRIDLIFRDMYDLDGYTGNTYLQDIDVILYINNIDNALNIKEGMILRYPSSIESLSNFRVNEEQQDKFDKKEITRKLVFPNKVTRKDNSREKFKENGYSLPPVVLSSPKPPISVDNGQFSIGGL
jgi:hypothetical protein